MKEENQQQRPRPKVRVGSFHATPQAVDQPDFATILAAMEFVPHNVQMTPDSTRIVYTGVSPIFEEVEPGGAVPQYHITVDRSHLESGGTIQVEAEKREPLRAISTGIVMNSQPPGSTGEPKTH